MDFIVFGFLSLVFLPGVISFLSLFPWSLFLVGVLFFFGHHLQNYFVFLSLAMEMTTARTIIKLKNYGAEKLNQSNYFL